MKKFKSSYEVENDLEMELKNEPMVIPSSFENELEIDRQAAPLQSSEEEQQNSEHMAEDEKSEEFYREE